MDCEECSCSQCARLDFEAEPGDRKKKRRYYGLCRFLKSWICDDQYRKIRKCRGFVQSAGSVSRWKKTVASRVEESAERLEDGAVRIASAFAMVERGDLSVQDFLAFLDSLKQQVEAIKATVYANHVRA